MTTWIHAAIEAIKNQRVEHAHYSHAVARVFNAVAVAKPGEVVVVVGPSRVGKSSAVAEAIRLAARPTLEMPKSTPTVWVEGENASTDGKFSTKMFMWECCKSIAHPIYGVRSDDDPFGYRLEARIPRTTEGALRSAFEYALVNQSTKYLVIDEAHHVAYSGTRGNSAVAILDSWKCLAQKTGVVLVLVGAYQLLDIMTLSPHLLGRQRPIEFPPYYEDDAIERRAFQQLLKTYSQLLRFEEPDQSLMSWTNYIMEGSFGCLGHLSLWLRATLGELLASDGTAFSLDALRHSQLPANQAHAIAAEMQRGARSLASALEGIDSTPTPLKKAGSRRPFQRATKRFPLDGRA